MRMTVCTRQSFLPPGDEATLSPEFTQEVKDSILKPSDAIPYDTLKKTLVEHTAALGQCRLQQLFNSEELGDKKPNFYGECSNS